MCGGEGGGGGSEPKTTLSPQTRAILTVRAKFQDIVHRPQPLKTKKSQSRVIKPTLSA